MILEAQRNIHEDLERLEAAIADRVADEPRHIRDRLERDHQIGRFLTRIEEQSTRLRSMYTDEGTTRARELQAISTGDPFDEFYQQLGQLKDFHRRYPNEPVENLERAYKRRAPLSNGIGGGIEGINGGGGELTTGSNGAGGGGTGLGSEVDAMFSGEEAWGKFLDLTALHDEYLNLPDVKGVKRLSYIQYLDTFHRFGPPACPVRRTNKRTDQYFRYVGRLADYLEGFMRRTRPLEDLDRLFRSFDDDFERAWAADDIPGWGNEVATGGGNPSGAAAPAPATEGTGEGVWCPDCQKEFKNDNVYKAHLTGKKHIKAAAARKAAGDVEDAAAAALAGGASAGGPDAPVSSIQRLKDRAIAEREYRIGRLANAMLSTRNDTRVNVERKQGMTEKERQQELDALFAMDAPGANGAGGAGGGGAGGGGGGAGGGRGAGGDNESSDDEGEEKIYNPLKLPLAWDGRPIPYWLYKLHGLGVEFSCEICGNFVYMGRRAFDKHFSEGRHVYGLKCLGISNTSLFREITRIDEALRLWEKLRADRDSEKKRVDNVVEMEDADGHVMPEKVYYDLQKQGLL